MEQINIDKKKWVYYLCVGLIFCMAMVVELIRLKNYAITPDEAYSYYGFVEPIFKGNILKNLYSFFITPRNNPANNHWLNTILVGLITTITQKHYNDLIIRMPIFLFFIAYLIICYSMLKNECIKIWQLCLLLLNFYITEFFALARGYAYAMTLVLAAIYCIEGWKKTRDNICIVYTYSLLTLAIVAHTLSLLPAFCIYVFFVIYLIYEKKLVRFIVKHWLVLIVLVIINLIMVKYHFIVSRADTSLYYESGSLYQFILSYIKLIMPKYSEIMLTLIIVVCAMEAIFRRQGRHLPIYTILFLSCVLITFIATIIYNVGFPAGRELLPTYPLFIMALGEIFELNLAKNNEIKSSIYCAAVFLFLIIEIPTIRLRGSSNWSNCENNRKVAYEILQDRRIGTLEDFEASYYSSSINYYRRQILLHYEYDIMPLEPSVEW